MARSLRAFGLGVATVLASAILASFALTLILTWSSGGSPADDIGLELFLLVSLVSIPFTILGLVLFGLPADYVLRAIECRHPLVYAACGLAGGLMLAVIVTGAAPGFWPIGLTGMGYGLVTSLVFWALFRRWRTAEDEPDPHG